MSGDKLVFDLANEVEDQPNIFLRRDWVNIIDNQNGNYNSNQSVIDTSQLSNSNKYMGYREGYLAVPMVMTLTSDAVVGAMVNSSVKSTEFAIGLKNWFGQIIHSLTLDFNGTTVIQQTPFINMWNSFKLMTSLSWQDVKDFGSTMGFYPDDPLSWSYGTATSLSGKGVCNNTNMRPPFNCLGTKVGVNTSTGSITGGAFGTLASNDNTFSRELGNEGFLRRQIYISYDGDCSNGSGTYGADQLSTARASQLWKSYVQTKIASTGAVRGVYQVAIMAFVHLRHIHSFFNQIPLIKGAFMKLTLNLNNTTTNFQILDNAGSNAYSVTSVSNAVGGVNPIMLASRQTFSIGCVTSATTSSFTKYGNGGAILNQTAATDVPLDAITNYVASISVGNRCLNSAQVTAGATQSSLSPSIILYVPAYSFNSVFEQAYISNPIKKIMYEDVYQYQISRITGESGQINNLVTNGIANLRSVLILPFYSANDATHLCAAGVPVYQSPFDPAGTGPTSPLCLLSNFNIVVSGQNAIYNTERYSFEQFINQTYGCNSVNAGLTDGLSSSLIDQLGWEMEYCYHYVDVSRMLPVEQQVPKSVQVIGQNNSRQEIDLWCFLAYGCELSFDIVSGARV
jgi:hypothetical protein